MSASFELNGTRVPVAVPVARATLSGSGSGPEPSAVPLPDAVLLPDVVGAAAGRLAGKTYS